MPLDYMQGHKDGMEWAAQLAEANHPETGDWLYDDPIELAKAIRKGPDIPPAQPVADSDPVIIVGDDGGDALSYRRLIQSFEPGTKLYRHAQPALVIPDEMTPEQAYEIGDYHGDPVDVFARGANWMRQHIIDSTLAAAPQSPGSEPATVPGKWIPVSERMPERGDYLVTDGCDFDVQLFNGEQFIPGFVWEDKITHWMPLPAAPQEVKGE
ncbi:TPA: DUF551 domain-containing protein [Klebsiella pneumoniae]|nr:DUF551 domain-containing protein [Klebsiella pneumoniae]HBQ7748367.1 DUF551 domain-containing protein [Klebsiella pneumoniae]HBQ7753987.1 DUF551 domain-containing protein [Klebsiella pneumoniae]HBQ7759903.1 DUF551 domain-containing protein [Klebsiella pneumoniae]HBQ7765558.1 DUF551 domain-containing protein [Klebsiella pneumoniae]